MIDTAVASTQQPSAVAGPGGPGGYSSEHPIRLFVVDDQELVRSGFRVMLNAQPDMAVMGEAANGIEAVNLVRELCPDVVLMDIRMPLLDGLEATGKILELCPATRVLILTTFDLDEYVYRALRIGASGFLLKDTDPRTLVDAVRTVAAGDALLSPAVTRRLIERFTAGEFVPTQLGDDGLSAQARWMKQTLTEREFEIWMLVARGLSNDDIAAQLYISPATAKTHVNRIMQKLDAHDRAQLVVLAYENHLMNGGSHA
ncbi:MAG: response regulator transcription factor [Actinomycetes bacterium]|jgi:DNA-binding NarL/FixJ family response regulator|nr:response regulator transcription factor [Actinomycetes bacterium]